MLRHAFFITLLLSNEYGRVSCSVQAATYLGGLNANNKICVDTEKHSEVFTRSKIHCVHLCDGQSLCTSVFYSSIAATCTLCSGHTNLQDQAGTLFYFKEINIEGKMFQIHSKENNKFWHFDGGHPVLKVVSALWQPNDNFVRFTFEKQTDGSYKIKSVAMPLYMYDGFDVPGAKGIYLNGDDQIDDDHMRYFVTMETPGYYRIKTKATNRYVRLDPDNYVSSIYNIADNWSLFKLVEV